MIKQNPDFDLKKQDYGKWVKGQSTEALDLELFLLEIHRTGLQYSDPKLEEEKEAQRLEKMRKEMLAKMKAMKPKKRAEAYKLMQGTLDEERADGPVWLTERAEVSTRISAVQLELQARRIQELSKGEAASALAGTQKLPKPTPEVAARRAVVRRNATQRTFKICEVLDDKEIGLPLQKDWDSFREGEDPWATAYRQGGKKLRRRIRVIISKDKKV